jgi:hypothetical protein
MRIYNILESVYDKAVGFVTSVIGDSFTKTNYDTDAVNFYPPGFIGLSPDAKNQQAAEAITYEQADRTCILGVRDERAAAIAGNLKPGETCLFALGPEANGQGRIMLKDKDGVSTISIYTTVGNSENGTSILISMSSDNSINIINGAKSFCSFDADGNIILGNTAAGIRIGSDGTISISGKTCQIGTQNVMLGLGASAATAVVASPTPVVMGVPPGSPLGVKPSGSVFVAP